MTTLVVGATGELGSRVCRGLRDIGRPVRAFVRLSSARTAVQSLEQIGTELAVGDLKSPRTLEPALRGVSTVISCASSVPPKQEGDSIESVDLRGHLHLVSAARNAGVEHFIFVSFCRHENLEFPLQTAKRAVESELVGSGIPYTIFQPVDFMESWLSKAAYFDPFGGSVTLLGDGRAKTTWISRNDVARFVVGAVDNQRAKNRIFPLGGPEALSQLEVLELFRAAGADKVDIANQSEATLEDGLKSPDPLACSFAAMMLSTARGQRASSVPAQ
ncbi:MAG TPA: SDR family oxidoreductase, partial [Polyangiaceae bacterium]|nr:SDR family oxidoreductase [Polyangiaceae bacterium]